jgi:hypothetical protein
MLLPSLVAGARGECRAARTPRSATTARQRVTGSEAASSPTRPTSSRKPNTSSSTSCRASATPRTAPTADPRVPRPTAKGSTASSKIPMVRSNTGTVTATIRAEARAEQSRHQRTVPLPGRLGSRSVDVRSTAGRLKCRSDRWRRSGRFPRRRRGACGSRVATASRGCRRQRRVSIGGRQ